MKELVQGQVEKAGLKYSVKIEGGKLKIDAEVDLLKGLDLAAESVPGDSPVEAFILSLAKSAVLSV